jgi:PPP family 3-phenylpropionic acid transporter
MQRRLLSSSFSLSAIYFLYYFGYGCLYPFLAIYLQDYRHFNGTQVGMLMSISPIVMIFAQSLWGMLCDYTQKSRQLLSMAMVLTAATGLVTWFVHGYFPLIALFVVLAFFQSAIVPIIDSITIAYSTRSGKEYGGFAAWGAVGFGTSVFMLGKVADYTGLAIIFGAFAVTLVVCQFFTFYMPRENSSLKVDLLNGIHALVRIPRFLLFLAATFLIFGPIIANNFYFSFYVKSAGGTLAGVGISFMLAVGSEVPFMKTAGSFVRKWGIIPIMIAATLVSGIRWVLYFYDMPLSFVYVTSVLQGFSVGLFIPAAIHYVYRLAPNDVKVTAVSLFSTMGSGLGTWFCTFLGGILLERYSIHATYLFFGILTFAGLASLLILRKMELLLPDKIDTVK